MSPDSDYFDAQALYSICSLRLDRDPGNSLIRLEEIADSTEAALDTRVLAAYEAGRQLWRTGRNHKALDRLSFAYLNTQDEDLFLRAGCSIFLLMKVDKSLRDRAPSIYAQMRSSRPLYDWDLQKSCMPEADEAGSSLLGKPGEWVVALYRSQIGPTIGMRCSCIPSCSEYFRQACRKHGLLGFAMQADRFYREPDIVKYQMNPIVVGEHIKYRDPVSDHDFWFMEEKQ